jgi:delta 1-pyrroline-5-carboxylate dehydrogenase
MTMQCSSSRVMCVRREVANACFQFLKQTMSGLHDEKNTVGEKESTQRAIRFFDVFSRVLVTLIE